MLQRKIIDLRYLRNEQQRTLERDLIEYVTFEKSFKSHNRKLKFLLR